MTVMLEKLKPNNWRMEGLDNWIIGLAFLFVVGQFNEHLTAIKNLGIYLALLLTFLKLGISPKEVFTDIRGFVGSNGLPLGLLLLFLFSIYISSVFSYTQTSTSLTALFDETKRMLAFFLVVLGVHNKERLLMGIIYAMAVAMALGSWHFLVKDMPALSELSASFRVSRNYATYYEYLFPFILYQVFMEKRIWGKALLALVLLLGGLVLVLSGVRGAWLAVSIEGMFILAYVAFHNRYLIRKFLPYLIAGLLIALSFLFFAQGSMKVVERAFERGISLNGRDIIVKERMPVFIEHGDTILGIGHGGAEYHQFMGDHDAPKTVGHKEKGEFVYNRDEPFAIQLFYHFGLLGLVITSLLFVYMTYDLIRINAVSATYGVPVLAVVVGVFLVRGLFEGRYLAGLLFLYILYLLVRIVFLNQNGNARNKSMKAQSLP